MAACIFCEILAGNAPGSIVFRDSVCTAFMDLYPLGRGHVLVVPNDHCQYLEELDDVTRHHLFDVAHHVYLAQKNIGLTVDGTNWVVNDGRAAHQTVPHVHVHVVPRVKGDAPRVAYRFVVGMLYKVGLRKLLSEKARRQQLDETARKLASAMKMGA